jgi:hypothetical protein
MSKFKCTVCEENEDASACILETEDSENTIPTLCPWEVENKAVWVETK